MVTNTMQFISVLFQLCGQL